MKFKILILIIILGPIKLFAQSEKIINTWLYDLPITQNSKKLKKALERNINFRQPDSIEYTIFSDVTFNGKIVEPKLPKLGNLDSAKIQLMFGSQNNIDNYSGNIKLLKFEYFSKDTLYIEELFKYASLTLDEDSKKQKPTGFKNSKNASSGKGTEFIYVSSPEQVSKIDITRVKYSNGTTSFQILYVGSTK